MHRQRGAEILEVPAEELLNSEPIILNVYNNSGGSNGWYNQQLVQHFPEEFMQRWMERQEAHMVELQRMNTKLLELLEGKMS